MDSGQEVNMLDMQSQNCRYNCLWDFCRLSFLNHDLLYNHVLAEHVRRAIPVRRRDIPLDIRAEEGLGPSLQISDLMRDPSASAPQTHSTQDVQASQEHLSSSLPSPPASSPLTQPRQEPEDDAVSFTSRPVQSLHVQNHIPTFMSLVSPQGSIASLQIPASPTFSSLVRAPLKRKAEPRSEEGPPTKHPRREEIAQPASSFDSSTSQNIIAQQKIDSDEDDEDYNPYDSSDSDTSSDSGIGDEQKSPTPGPATQQSPTSPTTPILPTGTQNEADLYKAELDWPTSQDSSSQIPAFSPPATQSQHPLHVHESLSQPPSQLALPPLLQHGPESRRPTHTLEPILTGADIAIPISQNSPVAVASPTFAASTPTRQNWYQPSALIRRKSGKAVAGGSSGGSTPKASPPEQHTIMSFPQSPASEPKSQPSQSSQKPTSRRMGFQSGNLAAARNSFSPKKSAVVADQTVTKPLSKPPPTEPALRNSFVNDDSVAALLQKTDRSVDVPQDQSQPPPDSQMSDLHHSYPEIMTQPRYDYSKLD